MSDASQADFDTRSGRQLYNILPEIYRSRDTRNFGRNAGDLALYLDAFGELYDAVKTLLDQRLADAFPDNPEQGLACQEWLLPYFAQLVNAKLLSPSAKGKRDEVTNAVIWRQSKGTLVVAEQIAEAVGQFEAELHEGWKRVAMTARLDLPLTSAILFGYSEDEFPEQVLRHHPRRLARHPGMPSGTVDMRWQGRAALSEENNPAAQVSRFAGRKTTWRPINPAGAPANAGSFDDPSKRTVDFRKPNWKHGHYHPRHLLVYVPIAHGLVPPPPVIVDDSVDVSECVHVAIDQVGEFIRLELSPISNHPVTFQRDLRLPDDLPEVLAGLDDAIRLQILDSGVSLYQIRDLQFNQTLRIDSGRLQLSNCKVVNLDCNDAVVGEVVAAVSDSLCEQVEVNGLADFDYSTVLGLLRCDELVATDSLFAGDIRNFLDQRPLTRAQYCRMEATIRAELLQQNGHLSDAQEIGIGNIVTATPQFLSSTINGQGEGVLAPNCPEAIYRGASNSAELGFRNRLKTYAQVVEGDHAFELPADFDYRYQNIVFSGSLTITAASAAPIQLDQVAAVHLEVLTPRLNEEGGSDGNRPTLNATGCIFETLAMGQGVARLEYCSVLNTYTNTVAIGDTFLRLQASDCIFANESFGNLSGRDCIRYSRIPASVKILENTSPGIRFPNCTDSIPTFYCNSIVQALSKSIGCAVLHPSVDNDLCFGAEDGGEMGAHHDWHFCLKNQAVVSKLIDHLPMGIQPVLVPDEQLNQHPLALCRGSE